jgi:DNA ligase (NAD+)
MAEVPEKTIKEMEKLVRELSYHSYRYYVLDSPVISDEDYDRMYRRLCYPWTTPFPWRR